MKAVKYTFDNSFAPTGNRPPVVRAAPKLDAKAVDQIKQEMYEKGISDGYQQAMAQTEARIADCLAHAGSSLSTLEQQEAARQKMAKIEIAKLALSMANKLAESLIAQHPLNEIEALVADCMETCQKQPRLIIKVNEDLVESLEARVGILKQRQHFDGEVLLSGDPAIPVGDCKIEWRDGGAERNHHQLLASMEAVVTRYTESLNGNQPADITTSSTTVQDAEYVTEASDNQTGTHS